MTIDEAIKILQKRYRIGDPLKNPDYEDALKLGIEALRRIQEQRELGDTAPEDILPGETEN